MNIKMEITFNDGSTINLTEGQFLELKSIRTNKIKIKDRDINYLKIRILKHIESCGGKVTSGRLVNVLRCYNMIDDYNLAILELVNDGIIKITESTNKYNKAISKIITII